jgi:hypothetical protein
MRMFCRRCGSPVLVNGECSKSDQHSVGFFDAMRRTHPVKLGEVFDGKRVVETFWQWTPDNGDVPMYRTEGETAAKAAS